MIFLPLLSERGIVYIPFVKKASQLKRNCNFLKEKVTHCVKGHNFSANRYLQMSLFYHHFYNPMMYFIGKKCLCVEFNKVSKKTKVVQVLFLVLSLYCDVSIQNSFVQFTIYLLACVLICVVLSTSVIIFLEDFLLHSRQEQLLPF